MPWSKPDDLVATYFTTVRLFCHAVSSPQIVVTNNGAMSASFTALAQALSPSFFVFSDNQHVAAVHLDGTLSGRPGEFVRARLYLFPRQSG
ncbi:MAG TPA: hypothetical protein VK776_25320 [Bryobacteraceae bacterium]|jgi:hypothetical protein|nr:hypothetical protein [Bryobacteraceae bacterium]